MYSFFFTSLKIFHKISHFFFQTGNIFLNDCIHLYYKFYIVCKLICRINKGDMTPGATWVTSQFPQRLSLKVDDCVILIVQSPVIRIWRTTFTKYFMLATSLWLPNTVMIYHYTFLAQTRSILVNESQPDPGYSILRGYKI